MSVSGEAGSKYWGHHFFDDLKNSALEKVKKTGNGDNVASLSPRSASEMD